MEISFFTTLEPALAGAWIPSFAMVLIQFAYMFIYKEVGKRATDTSWYTLADKRNAIISSLLQVALLILSMFVPLKTGSALVLDRSGDLRSGFCGFHQSFLRLCGSPCGQSRTRRHLPPIAQSDVFFLFPRHGGRLYRFSVAVATHSDGALCHIQPSRGPR